MNSRKADGSSGKHENDDSHGSQETPSSHKSHSSHSSHQSPRQRPIIPPRGDYQTLLSFQKAEAVYDITFRFAHKYLGRGDRTVDQMIQSARSGKQHLGREQSGNDLQRNRNQTNQRR